MRTELRYLICCDQSNDALTLKHLRDVLVWIGKVPYLLPYIMLKGFRKAERPRKL